MTKRMMRTLTLLLACLLAAACAAPATVPEPIDAPASPALAPPAKAENGPVDFFYVSKSADGARQLRSTKDPAPLFSPVQWFTLSPDGKRLAVVVPPKSELVVMNADGTGQTQVAAQVWEANWRPGTGDIVYLIRPADRKWAWQWHVRSADGSDRVILDRNTLDTKRARVSPDGKWLVYTAEVGVTSHAWELRAVDLDSGAVHKVYGENGFGDDLYRWLSPSTLSVIGTDKTEIVQYTLPDGQREVRLTIPSGLRSHQWAPDGKRVVVQTENPGVELWQGNQRVARCEGAWEPGRWSASGRYILLRLTLDRNSTDQAYYIMEADRFSECQPVRIPGIAMDESPWHPNQDSLLLEVGETKDDAGDLQLWTMAPEGPQMLKSFGPGYGGTWSVNR